MIYGTANNKLVFAHIVYGVLLLTFGLAAAALQDAADVKGLFFSMLADAGLVVPLAMLLALRFYRLSLLGVALTGGVVTLLAHIATVGIYSYLAQPAAFDTTLSGFYANGRAMAIFVTSLVTIGAGMIWLVVLQRMPLWFRTRKSSP